ncbi:MAG TPA: NAD-dependent epimerase/dehydratase family protein [Baekduia sp.]|uniref:NAD-dependent epimerase/dehydratase family protein n=1 Tax=Baekduia sp. TaxID=2600305 RepID=UPI002D785654|nr:NAD-dependent epimerase/dehydratase family protein [Baekduia sp.]HET6509509.1 NAD-dependent epimerase/dehydratase family protein [Baekduia sp.]
MSTSTTTRNFVAGGAGFIGSHMTRTLLRDPEQEVVVYDNLSSGTPAYLDDVLDDERLTFVVGDLQDLEATTAAIEGCDRMFLYAANPDIAKAVTEPAIDFWQGTYLTNNAIEAARVAGVRRIVYSSGSGVYGDRGEEAVREDAGAMHPVSTYGASKLACEAMLSAYSHMFGIEVVVFRFANVVGPRQTHGVTYDFVRRLRDDPERLRILGDGRQSKSYIHVSDVVDAMLSMADRPEGRPYEVFNAGTLDYVTVAEIADLCCARLGLDPADVRYEFSGGTRGWKGDVPVVRFDSGRLRALGWRTSYTSREALVDSIDHNIVEARAEVRS